MALTKAECLESLKVAYLAGYSVAASVDRQAALKASSLAVEWV